MAEEQEKSNEPEKKEDLELAQKAEAERKAEEERKRAARAARAESRRPVWVRGFYMAMMLLIWFIAETVLLGVAFIQFIFALTGGPNEQLTRFGGGLARYLQQIAAFVTFSSNELPFPFSDWPDEA